VNSADMAIAAALAWIEGRKKTHERRVGQ
jgi:hypothetical protein